ncbi:uncharacterized protein CANTADRAFT_229287 [Suhomyces tanzawaensis NRRL Y-17324]|uniref:Uncharacterized protein n=1 Tax=Suhomyces tanzawaensis NRRL Y-17324 TaxID=984487 RepID=A0A1E4SKZ2_9ASCO|nr:uncharacterized protein CANTADRAFT_229287 [Suhomyces tanzawaensis NRRL Y-17324]ODV80169.1 hypothetical protein CANTADRAFT_229287 [Suhomyces tanzawaensis NRRL Y-17324]
MELNRRQSLASRKSVGKFNQLSFAGNKDSWQVERNNSDVYSTNFPSSLGVQLPQGSQTRTPTAKADLNPRNIVKKVAELQEKVMVSGQLTQFQKTSLSDTLAALNTFVYSLAAQYPDNEIPFDNFTRIQNLLWSLAQLVQNATLNSSRGPKYGIFQDRLSNLSPSISSKSNYDDDLIQASRLSVNSISKPHQHAHPAPANLQFSNALDVHQRNQAYQLPSLQYPHASLDNLPTLQQEPQYPYLNHQYPGLRSISPVKNASHHSSMPLREPSPVLPDDGTDSEFEDEADEYGRASLPETSNRGGAAPGVFAYNGMNTPGHTPSHDNIPYTTENRRSTFEHTIQGRGSAYVTPPAKESLKKVPIDFKHPFPTRNEFDMGHEVRGRPQSMHLLQRGPGLGGGAPSFYRNSYAQPNFGQTRSFDD